MTLDAMFAVLAIIIAGYSVLPTTTRLTLRIRATVTFLIIICGGFILANIFIIIKLLATKEQAKSSIESVPLIKYDILAYATIIITFALAAVVLNRNRLTRRNLKKFSGLVNRLLFMEKYSEALAILKGNLKYLTKHYKKDFWLLKYRDKVIPSERISIKNNDILWLLKQGTDFCELPNDGKPNILNKISCKINGLFAKYIRDGQREKDEVEELFSKLFYSNKFIEYIAKIDPYFILKLIKNDVPKKYKLLERSTRSMLDDKGSILYYEISNNQNNSSRSGYYMNPRNRFIYFLFFNPVVAKETYAWTGPGEYVIELLWDLGKLDVTDEYNMPLGENYDDRKWECPIFISIRYFDLMVTRAFFENVDWHMWLYYFWHFTRGITNNININNRHIDLDDEFPNKYMYLLYEIVQTLLRIPEYCLHANSRLYAFKFERINLWHENDNILKSSLICLGQVVGCILACSTVPNKFKHYIIDIVLGKYFKLRAKSQWVDCAVVLRGSLVQGGNLYEVKSRQSNLRLIKDGFDRMDKIPYAKEYVREFEIYLKNVK